MIKDVNIKITIELDEQTKDLLKTILGHVFAAKVDEPEIKELVEGLTETTKKAAVKGKKKADAPMDPQGPAENTKETEAPAPESKTLREPAGNAPEGTTAPSEAKDEVKSEYTLDHVRNAFISAGARGIELSVRKRVITKYGVATPNELDPKYYGEVIEALDNLRLIDLDNPEGK